MKHFHSDLSAAELQFRLDRSHESGQQAFFYIDMKTREMYICRHYRMFTGEKIVDTYNRFEDWAGEIYESDAKKILCAFEVFAGSGRRSGGFFETEFRVGNGRGGLVWLFMRGRVEKSTEDGRKKLVGVIIDVTSRVEMNDKLVKLNESLVKRDKILEIIASAGEKMLECDKFSEVFTPILEKLGKALGVSRVYVFHNIKNAAGKVEALIQAYWMKKEFGSLENFKQFKKFSIEKTGLSKIHEALSLNKEFVGLRSSFNGEAGKFFDVRSVKSFLLIPIIAENEFSGVIGFDDCAEERIWNAVEIETLKILSKLIAAAWINEKQKNEITESEKKYRDIIENSSEGFIIVDMKKTVKFANRRMAEILECGVDDIIGKSVDEFLFDEEVSMTTASLLTMESGKRVRGEFRFKSKTGKILTVMRTSSAIEDPDGKVAGALCLITDMTEMVKLKEELAMITALEPNYNYHGIVGSGPLMKAVFKSMDNASRSDCNVLIEGPSGTGKSLVARIIHELSVRGKGPFVVVNCGAIPETLIESELFGYAKGAFTDARTDKPGRFAMADGGTIFLDEIGEMPYRLQVKLLRVIEDKKYEPLGSAKTINADVRVIAATNRDIQKMISGGSFREDLYYRLKIINIAMPALVERAEDIMLITRRFIQDLNRKYSKGVTSISQEVKQFMLSYEFPGNIRELQNIIESAFVSCESDIIQIADLPAEYGKFFKNNTTIITQMQQLRINSELSEISTIVRALDKSSNNKTAAAKLLNIDRITLWRKMKKYHLT